jgi:hypothetical protein
VELAPKRLPWQCIKDLFPGGISMTAAASVYQQIYVWLEDYLPATVDPSTRQRLALLVTGMLQAKHASPARIARAAQQLGLSHASAESIERRVRRFENDPEVSIASCLHPLVRQRLAKLHTDRLYVLLDPTTQEDRVVMVAVALWYRGRALPLAWAVWPANTPLQEDRFWKRIASLLDTVKELLPRGVDVVWLADRAFGTPAFTDLVEARGWDYIVRVQDQTRCQLGAAPTAATPTHEVRRLVRMAGQRFKGRGRLFKKRGWRQASVVVYWGARYEGPLCLVSNLRPRWELLAWYKRRFPIEALFRDGKSHGWQWEQGQVVDLAHVERLLVAMALATWVVLCAGTQAAAQWLARRVSGRRSVPWIGKRSLFQLGLDRVQALLSGGCSEPLEWALTEWDAPNWQRHIRGLHVRALIFGGREPRYWQAYGHQQQAHT